MTKKIFIPIFIFLSIFVFPKEKLNIDKLKTSHFVCLLDNIIKKQSYIITYKLLPSAGILFLDENNFRLNYDSSEPRTFIHFEYKIKDDVLYTYLNKEKSKRLNLIPDELKQNTLTWTLEKDETNLYCNEKLVSNTNFTLWNIKSKVPEGSIRSVDDTKIYIINQKSVSLLYNTKIRKGPGTNYDYNNYKLEIDHEGLTEINYLPKGHSVLIIGRTIMKQKIDDMEDYWYYCLIRLYIMTGEDGEDHGWIFGALLDK